ncbi:hypothetical protein HWC07_gp057 [Pantoea phage vB_PagM_LIET2]|uniref:Uncharacterized protein n=1 Tax=Pantoea phage vB_PagM_LIET2 TaxID=2508071 RepID=A0A411AW50_9CAUD|nr:hypothetical protein HWC07_gp057 [Pantoea phage vB_PagM_LIET2]QAX92309.1 hypothetical protein LIET2_gp057 [Pantoea phage vB_PagM_LIET2]
MNDNIQHLYWKFSELEALDPVAVHIEINMGEDPAVTANRPFTITVRCFGEVWTTYFSGPSGTPTEFLRGCNTGYIVERLHNPRHKTKSSYKVERQYLTRIWDAIKPLMLTQKEAQTQYLAELLGDQEPINYNGPEDAPRFDNIVVVSYLGDDERFGPAPACRFDWHHAEGQPNIEKYWIVPGSSYDTQKD